MESSYISLDHLALNVTKRCNQRCIFCFEGDRKGWDEIDLKQIKEMVKSAIKRGISRIIFMGAETLLKKDILDIIRECKKMGIKDIGVFTNGQVLMRDGFIEQLYDAGLNYISISFHYPDELLFEKVTRTNRRFYDRLCEGIRRVDQFNKYEKRILLNTETLLFSVNQRHLLNIIKKVIKLITYSNHQITIKRIQRFHHKVIDNNLYLLDDLTIRSREIQQTLDYAIREGRKVLLTRVPLCIIPKDYLMFSLDVIYRLKDSAVLANFAHKGKITNMDLDNIIPDFLIDPFKDVCVECNLLGLCPMGSSCYENPAFYPYESQRPLPYKGNIRPIVNKIAENKKEADIMQKRAELLRMYILREYKRSKG